MASLGLGQDRSGNHFLNRTWTKVTLTTVNDTSQFLKYTTTPEYVYTKEIIIWKLNEEQFKLNYPCMLCLIVAFVLGVFGNGCVVYVFGFRFKRNNTNIFTACLSACDFIISFLLVFEIFDKRFPMYSGTFPILCKIFRFFEIFTNSAAAFLLLGITFDRYFKICKPLKRMSAKTTNRVLISSFIIPLICTWPMAVFHGPEVIPTPFPGVYGQDCADDDFYSQSVTRKLFYSIVMLIIVVSIVILIVVYSLIFVAIRKWKHQNLGESYRYSKRYNSDKHNESVCTDHSLSLDTVSYKVQPMTSANVPDKAVSRGSHIVHSNNEGGDRFNCQLYPYDKQSTLSTVLDITTNSVNGIDSSSDNAHVKHSPQSNKETQYHSRKNTTPKKKLVHEQWHIKRRRMNVTTLMFCLVSILYIVSYLPTVAAEALHAVGVAKEADMSDTGKQLFIIANISYFLNGSLNPIIYGLCNRSFRIEVSKLFISK